MSGSTSRPTAHHWGSGIAVVENGRLKGVNPHPIDPDPSRINENIVDGIYGKSRVLKPAVRKSYLEAGLGAKTHARGSEPFVEVSWDTALDLVAAELQRVRTHFGNRSIFGGSYGWASAGRFHHAQSQLKRFLNATGGFIRSWGNYSYHAALVLMPHIVGNFRDHVRQATRWRSVAKNGELVIMFGGAPMRNVQISGGGIARHRLHDELKACADAGVRFVNFSPYAKDAPQMLGAQWVPLRPGTDTAVMMGLAHTLLVNEKHNQDFLRLYTSGFGRVAAYLLGDADGKPKDADWASAISGVDANVLRELAMEMSEKRTMISTAASLQRAKYGEQPLWMTVTLAALLGQIGLPGGGYGIAYGADASIGAVDRPIHWPAFPIGDYPLDEYIPVACIADMLLNPGEPYDFNGRQCTYPDIRLVWWAGGNPFHHHQDLNKLRRAFARPDTIIVNEIAWTGTARHADIVLPATSPLERSDFGAGNQDNALIPMPQAIEPVGEARDEYDVYCALENRLNLGKAFSMGRSKQQWLESMWREMTDLASEQDFNLPEFSSFMAGDIVELPDPAPEAVFLQEFRDDPERNPLTTPSGKIELWSEVIESFEYTDCPGHACWLFDDEHFADNDYPLHLLSGQPETRLHSQLDAGAFSTSRKIKGREPVLINVEDAAARGICENDIVVVHNNKGSCLAGAKLTSSIAPGSVFLWTGAWYDPDFSTADHRDRHGNPNVLTDDCRTSRLSQGPAVQAKVEIEKFTGDPPPVRAFDPPLELDPSG
ncbi:MAG: molybdopterin-dependent oxidoreductase [Pseudomonadota bacterium]